MPNGKEEREVCRYALRAARHYHVKEKKPLRAFAHLMTAFKIRPSIRNKYLEHFNVILEAVTITLATDNRFNELITCYDTAADVFSDNEVVLNDIGRHLISILKAVDCGVKPSYLWDSRPFLSARVIRDFLQDLKNANLISQSLQVAQVGDDVFVLNADRVRRVVREHSCYFKFYDACSLEIIEPQACPAVLDLLNNLEKRPSYDFESWSPSWGGPCLFGVLLGYPVVYWLDSDALTHNLNSRPLVLCKVWDGPTELFSFTHGSLSELSAHVDNWFKSLEAIARRNLSMRRSVVTYPSIVLVKGFQGHDDARRYFEKSLTVDPNYLPAFGNLQNVKMGVVERWHFRMLNDNKRNDAFKRAIRKKVKAGLSDVLDIGTGTGLLSLYAHEAGANYICACDYSSVMVSIASKVFSENLPSDSLKLIKGVSTDLSVPDDIPRRCSLLVTETMDACLLGEHILSTVAHACSQLILPSQGPEVEPCQRVIPASASLLAAPIECVKIARKHYFLSPDRVPQQKLNFDGVNLVKIDESYDTENLNALKDFRLLGDPVRVLSVNFNHSNEVASFAQCELENDFAFNQNGVFDAVAVWFEVFLDSEISLNTSPLTSDGCPCWDQGIFPIHYPVTVSPQSQLKFLLRIKDNEISFRVSSRTAETVRIPQSSIQLLNCVTYQTYMEGVIRNISRDRLETSYILDASHFPYVGYLLSSVDRAQVIAFNEIDPTVLKSIVKNDRLAIKPLSCLENSDDCAEELKEGNKLFNIAVFEFVNSRGELNHDLLSNMPNICNLLTADCLVIPAAIEIWCQLVYSDQLVTYSRVTEPEICSKYKLAEFINDYSVSTQLDLRLDELEHDEMSPPFHLATLQTLDFGRSDSGSGSNCRFDAVAQTKRSGRVNAVFVWFHCVTTLSASDHRFNTRCPDSYVNQIAEVLPRDTTVMSDQMIPVSALYNSGILKFINVGDQLLF